MEINSCANEPIMHESGDAKCTIHYAGLIESGLDKTVADKLDGIYKTGKLIHSHLDEDFLPGLKSLPATNGVELLSEFEKSENESADAHDYIQELLEIARSKLLKKGPDQAKLSIILNRTGFMLEVTKGQRRYCMASNQNLPAACHQYQLFCGKIPKDVYEDTLIPLFETFGKIIELRLMVDPLTQESRGYAFIVYDESSAATNAVVKLDGYEIKPNHCLKVTQTQPNYRLYVGNIPKSKEKQELFAAFSKVLPGLLDVIIYRSPDDKFHKNRGFCFLQFCSYSTAVAGKRKLFTAHKNIWGCDLFVDWADPVSEPEDSVMNDIKVLYVRNLKQTITEDRLKELFERYGSIERVKKIKDFAFVHFTAREKAIAAMNALNGITLENEIIEVTLSRPPLDKKKKEELLRARERRMMQSPRAAAEQHHKLSIMPQNVPEMNVRPNSVIGCNKCHCCFDAYSNNNSYHKLHESKYKIK